MKRQGAVGALRLMKRSESAFRDSGRLDLEGKLPLGLHPSAVVDDVDRGGLGAVHEGPRVRKEVRSHFGRHKPVGLCRILGGETGLGDLYSCWRVTLEQTGRRLTSAVWPLVLCSMPLLGMHPSSPCSPHPLEPKTDEGE